MTFIEEIRKPFNIITTVLAMASIALSIFFYYKSNRTKSLSYQINEPSSIIYDSKNASSAIKLLERDSVPIRDNVYILTGIIWNSGDLPLSNEDVRKEVILNLQSAKKILDFKIIKQLDPSVAAFNLKKQTNKSLALTWKYFDSGFAVKFQIIYTGSDNPNFCLSGKILDVNEFKKINTPIKTNMSSRIMGFIGTITSLVLVLFVLIVDRKRSSARSFIFYFVLFIVQLILLVYGLFFSQSAIPLFN